MRLGDTSVGLAFQSGLGFGGGFLFEVGLGLGIGPRRLQSPNPQHSSGLQRPEFRTQGWVPLRFSLWLPRPHMSMGPGRGGLWNPLGQLQPGLGDNMVSFQVPCRVRLHRFWTPGTWCCQTLELGPHGERALARVRVWSRNVARAEATLVS